MGCLERKGVVLKGKDYFKWCTETSMCIKKKEVGIEARPVVQKGKFGIRFGVSVIGETTHLVSTLLQFSPTMDSVMKMESLLNF